MKRLLAMLLALSMMFSLAACGSSSSSSSSSEESSSSETSTEASTEASTEEAADEAEEEDVYRVFNYGTDANSTTFDTAADLQTNSGAFLVHAVGDTLWTVDDDGNVTLKLAESYTYDETQLVITVREGVLFSNGDELDGEDVLATFKHLATTGRSTAMYSAMNLDEATVDGCTVTIPMNSYDAALIDLMGNASCMILDSEIITDDYDYSWIIGTGPYMLETWDESVSYTLVRNPYYWDDEPYYDELNVYFYSEESTRYADFQTGKLDAIYLTEATYVNNLSNGAVSGASLVQVEESGVYGFALASSDATTGAFADINVRMAFAHALDVETIIETLGEGIYAVPTSLVSEACWGYVDTGVYEYDPELAAEYLAAAGYSVDNPLTIYLYAESTSWASTVCEAAQYYLAEIGINLDLSGLADFATILPVLLSGEQDITISSASNGSGNDPANVLQQFGPLSDNSLLKVTDDSLISLWNEAISSSDTAARTEMYQEFIQAIVDDYLYIPLYVGTKNYGVLEEHTSFESAIDTSKTLDPTLLTD